MEYSQKDKDRFWGKVAFSQAGCWEWMAGKRKGYGRFSVGRVYMPAHRFAYMSEVVAIPSGFEVDHLCRNPSCVNPSHLEPVTAKENKLRGFGTCGVNARKKRCKGGHEYTAENTFIRKGGGRGCIQCRKEAKKKHWAKNAEAFNAKQRAARSKDPEKYREYQREWRAKNKEKVKSYNAKRYPTQG